MHFKILAEVYDEAAKTDEAARKQLVEAGCAAACSVEVDTAEFEPPAGFKKQDLMKGMK
mgnify:CR=1 FL=1